MDYELHEVIKELKEDNTKKFTDGVNVIGVSKSGFLDILETNLTFRTLNSSLNVVDSKWQLVRKPITFNEALESNKPVRVEHESVRVMDIRNCNDERINGWSKKLLNNEYLYMDYLLSVLSWNFSFVELRHIIQEGKWYIQ